MIASANTAIHITCAYAYHMHTITMSIEFDPVKARARPVAARQFSTMRDEYDFSQSRPNPHVARLGPKGRADLLRWWSRVAGNVRLLPEDLAREFPDTKSTVAALRLVMKLRKAASKATSSRNGRLRRSKRKAG